MSKDNLNPFPEASFEYLPVPTHEVIMGHETQASNTPMSVVVRNATHIEAADFVKSAETIDKLIEKESPDIVIIPQRGASPVRWALEEIANLRDPDSEKKVEFVDVPIGTAYDIPTDNETGITKGQKTALIRETLKTLEEQGKYIPGKSRIMLLDEVQKGGTITQAARSLRQTLNEDFKDENEIVVIAVEDSRRGFVGSQMVGNYRTMVANEVKGVKTHKISTSLFTVDRNPLLDVVATNISTLEKSNDVRLSNFKTVPNYPAKSTVQSLVRMARDPGAAQREIEAVRPNERAKAKIDGIEYEGPEKSVVQWILADYFTDHREIRKPISEEQLFKWISLYLRVVADKKRSLDK